MSTFDYETGIKNLEPESSGSEDAKPEEEALISNILNGGKDIIEQLIHYLQIEFYELNKWAKFGGENANSIVRATFALLLKQSNLFGDLQIVLDDLEFSLQQSSVNSFYFQYFLG